MSSWQADDEELASMLQTAESFRGTSAGSVVLKRGEAVYCELPSVGLVEVQRGQGHYVGGYSGFSFRIAKGIRYNVGATRGTYVQGQELHRVTDTGPLTITNQRVIFQGSRNSREWAFSKLLGVAHDPTQPVTLMHVSNRQKVSGISYAGAQAPGVHFYISLALADYQESRKSLVEQISAERSAHQSARPGAPLLVGPEDAPHGVRTALRWLRTAYVGRPGWPRSVRVGQAVVTVGLSAAVIAAAAGGGGGTGSSSPSLGAIADSSTAQSSNDAGAVSTAPSPIATPVTTVAKPRAVTHAKPAATVKPAAKPRPKPRPRTTHAAQRVVASTCGAPTNPWGYNFCGRGGNVYSPAASVCSYFNCIASFWNGKGYMTQCSDGTFSMSGGRSGACSSHGGEGAAVYSGGGPH